MAKKNEVKTEKIMATVAGDLPLNIRAGKTLESEVLGQYQPGDKVEILKEGKEWCRIDGGYLMRQFLIF